MKFFLLSVVCLVGSALSLPVASNRQRRDILPGDPRYGTDYHLHHHHHDNHHNGGVQVVKSVGEYSGSYNSPAPVYGPPGYQPGTPVSYPDQTYQPPTVHEQHYSPIIPSTSYGVPVQQHEHHQEQHHNHHPQQHHEHHHHQQHHEHHQEQHYQQQYHFEHQYQQTQPIHYQQQHQEHHYQSPQVSYGPPVAVKEQSVIAKETGVPITSYGTPVESHVHHHQHVQVPVQKTVASSNQHLSPAVEQHRQPQQHHVVQIQRHQVQQVKVPQYSYQPHYTPQVKQQPKPQPKPQPAQVYYQPQPIQTHYQPQPIQTHYQPAPQPTNNYLTPVIEVKKTQTVHHYQPQPAPQPTNNYLTPVEEKKAPAIDHYQPQPSPQPTHAYLTPVEEKKTPTIDHYPSQQAPQPTNIYLTPVEHEPKIAYTPAIKSVTVETAPAPQTYVANDTPEEETSSSGHPFPGFSDLSQIQKFAEFPPLEDSPLPSADQFSNSAQVYNDAVDIDSVNQGYNYNNNLGNTFTGYTSEQPTQGEKTDDHVEQQSTVSQEQTHEHKETIQQVDSNNDSFSGYTY